MALPPIIFIDKPTGITSFDVIRQLRRRTGIRKFGHAGTLDPAASGLMVIGVEAGTKQLTEYIKLDKEYIAEILLGVRTTTSDMDGEVIATVDEVEVSEQAIKHALSALQGTHALPVSPYSAIKKDGQPFYKRARAAATVGELLHDVPVRNMRVYETELLDVTQQEVRGVGRIIIKARFFVGSGTYIRSLAEDLGKMLGYPAVLYSLRRTQVGKWHVEDAQQLTDFS